MLNEKKNKGKPPKKLVLATLFIFSAMLLGAVGASAASCSETDGGKNYAVKGVTTYGSSKYTDICSGSYVKEYYCYYGYPTSTYYKCLLGCSNGACIQPAKCGDGMVNQPSEQCDDGNTVNGDGCSSTCQTQCIDIWTCGSWSPCTYHYKYVTRSCSKTNSCEFNYNKPSTGRQCTCYNTWVPETETVNIGNPASETGHNLTNWGPIEPDTHGGLWGSSPTGSSCCAYGSNLYPKAYDGSTRVVSTDSTGESASLSVRMGWGNFYRGQYLQFMALKGISGDDSFDVYVDGIKVYSFVDDGTRSDPTYCPENWVKHSVPITNIGTPLGWEGSNMPGKTNYAILNVTFVSTAPHWAYYYTYGQVAISEVVTTWSHNVDFCGVGI